MPASRSESSGPVNGPWPPGRPAASSTSWQNSPNSPVSISTASTSTTPHRSHPVRENRLRVGGWRSAIRNLPTEPGPARRTSGRAIRGAQNGRSPLSRLDLEHEEAAGRRTGASNHGRPPPSECASEGNRYEDWSGHRVVDLEEAGRAHRVGHRRQRLRTGREAQRETKPSPTSSVPRCASSRRRSLGWGKSSSPRTQSWMCS